MSLQRAWDEPGDEERSYLGEMLTHQHTLNGLLTSLAAGSLLAIPYDLGVAALPLVAFLGLTSLAALVVPGLPAFRRAVDARRRRERREQTREQLLRELRERVGEEHPQWAIYGRMQQRVASLRELSSSRRSAFASGDVERLDDATVDYLGLWLARLSMAERHAFLSAQSLDARIETARQSLAQTLPSGRKALEKALADLERLSLSRRRIEAHATSVDAQLLAMSDAVEEVYQGVMSNPSSSDASTRLQQAVDRMRIEGDLGSALDEDLEELLRGPAETASGAAAATRALKAR